MIIVSRPNLSLRNGLTISTFFFQTMLGDAINRIIKFYHKSLNEKISYAHLMCGQFGLVHALINIFSFG